MLAPRTDAGAGVWGDAGARGGGGHAVRQRAPRGDGGPPDFLDLWQKAAVKLAAQMCVAPRARPRLLARAPVPARTPSYERSLTRQRHARARACIPAPAHRARSQAAERGGARARGGHRRRRRRGRRRRVALRGRRWILRQARGHVKRARAVRTRARSKSQSQAHPSPRRRLSPINLTSAYVSTRPPAALPPRRPPEGMPASRPGRSGPRAGWHAGAS